MIYDILKIFLSAVLTDMLHNSDAFNIKLLHPHRIMCQHELFVKLKK